MVWSSVKESLYAPGSRFRWSSRFIVFSSRSHTLKRELQRNGVGSTEKYRAER